MGRVLSRLKSTTLNRRFAAIDIGTNGVRLLLASASMDQNRIEIRKDSVVRIPIRLGEDVFKDKKISNEKITDLVNTIRGFRFLIEAYKPIAMRAVATSAMREADNAKDVLKKIYKASQTQIELISGTEEAQTIYSAHLQQNYSSQSLYLYIDVGGGSTEVILFEKEKIIDCKSFNIGTVRSLQGDDNDEERKNLKKWLIKTIPTGEKITAVGTGGNINRAMKILGHKKQTVLHHQDIKDFYDKIKNMSTDEKIMRYKLKNDRADVIVPALKIYLTILKNAGLESIMVPNLGLVDGLIFELAKKNLS